MLYTKRRPITRHLAARLIHACIVATCITLVLCLAAHAQVLYAISGDGATPSSSLYTIDLATGGASLLGSLGNGDGGEAIAFGPNLSVLHHASGETDGLEFFETVNPDSLAVGSNLAPGAIYGPASTEEIFGLSWYGPLGVFLASDIDLDFFHVSPSGQFERMGNSGVAMRGFAVVGGRVYGISASLQELYEIDPSDGSVLATLSLTVDGSGTTGNGLATHPETGVVYAIVKNPSSSAAGRLLATLDVATGQATSIGDTGIKLAGLSFRVHAPLYAISGDGGDPPSTLYTLDLGTAAPTFATTLGNGEGGESISSRPGDGDLYHGSGIDDGLEYFERISPGTWSVGPNLVPGNTYGPDSATEISAIGWYAPLSVFLVGDIDTNFYHVTSDGEFTLVGNSGTQVRGLAIVGSDVYGLNPFSHELVQLDPTNGAVLNTLTLTLDGTGTTGNGLAINPDTGAVFAILKDPITPKGGRVLARLDVTTGAAVSIGNTGQKLAGITFGFSAPPGPEPVPALVPIGELLLMGMLGVVALGFIVRRARSV